MGNFTKELPEKFKSWLDFFDYILLEKRYHEGYVFCVFSYGAERQIKRVEVAHIKHMALKEVCSQMLSPGRSKSVINKIKAFYQTPATVSGDDDEVKDYLIQLITFLTLNNTRDACNTH